MIETVRYSIDGKRTHLEELLIRAGLRADIKDYPACSCVFLETIAGSDQQRRLEASLRGSKLDVGRTSYYQASPEELRTKPLFTDFGVRWTDDYYQVVAEPVYSRRDTCSQCGKGALELGEPLCVYVDRLKDAHFTRVPPGLFLGSRNLAGLAKNEEWNGLRVGPVCDRKTGETSSALYQLVITSTLPPRHPTGAPVRSPTPDFCEKCKKLGYQSPGVQPIYSRSVLDVACDWNLSAEWVAPHYVSCPELICSRRVVHRLLELEPGQEWIPVKLVD